MLKRIQKCTFLVAFAIALSSNAVALESLYTTSEIFSFQQEDFKLKATIDGSRVDLSWSLESDHLFEEIVVERSENGSIFRELYTLPEGTESFTDYISGADLDDRALFYRLKFIGADGKESYSDALELDLDAARNLKPNIIVRNDQIQVDFYSKLPSTTEVTLINNAGRPIKSFTIRTQSGDNSEYIEAGDLRSGLYFLRLEQRGEVTTTKFFVR